jgi:ABC-2 type transport system permease protein
MLERLKSMLVKEFIQVFRDPRMKTTIFVAPVLQIMIFGYAATTDVKNVPIAIYDLDNSPQSRQITRAFVRSRYFQATRYIDTDYQVRDLIDKSDVKVVLRFNHGFAADLITGKPAKIQLILDGTDSNTGAVVLSYANSIIENYSRNFLHDKAYVLLEKIGGVPSVDLRSRAWFNPNLVSRNFYLPGVIALIVSLMSLLLTSMAVVREKEIGTIEQLIVSPLTATELILGKLTPFAVIAIMEATFVTTIAVLWFKIPIRGSILLLLGSTLIYLLVSLGVGLLISTISSTQQEAMLSTFLFFLPANLLSGFIFPIRNMPVVIQYITLINPLRYYMVILRGIFLKGVGITILWPNMVILLVMGIAVLTISSLRFHKTIG